MFQLRSQPVGQSVGLWTSPRRERVVQVDGRPNRIAQSNVIFSRSYNPTTNGGDNSKRRLTTQYDAMRRQSSDKDW